MVALNGWQVTKVNGEQSSVDAGMISAPLVASANIPVPAMVWPSAADDEWGDPVVDEDRREQSRLQSEIAAAKARTAAAQHQAATREAEAHAALREALAASRQELAEMERNHEETLTMIREAASLEVDRIIGAARAEARRLLDTDSEYIDG